MNVKDQLLDGLSKKVPDARIFENIRLDSRRGGESADLILLHRTGVYVLLLLDLDGMLYGSESTGQWSLKSKEGSVQYLPDPIQKSRKHCDLLSKKARGIGDYLIPAVIYGENTWVVDSQVSSPVTFSGPEYFLSKLLLREQGEDFVSARQRDVFAKQLTMLQMLSRK